jgi:ABC-2 type transport system ATP-binding protein
MTRRPPTIEVRELHKAFRIPTERVHRLKERALHPLRGTRYTELKVLEDVSFDVGKGEFFGIVGANGSGKSTLLKLLASIYRADQGRILVGGRVIPFIELGVGFNPELTAHDNAVLNGVMMGLTPKEAERRFDEVMDFAGLREFAELQLKNYSSGMQVRLGFAVMLQVPGEVLLIDEVLAVGDASFQEKCTDSLTALQREGRTIVFVTHSMPMVERYCDRAMLLHRGRIERIGEPAGVTSTYLDLGRTGGGEIWAKEAPGAERGRLPGEIIDLRLEDESGRRRQAIESDEQLDLHAGIELRAPVERAWVKVELQNEQGTVLFASGTPWIDDGRRLAAGERLRFRATIENRLVPGSYSVTCTLLADDPGGLGTLTVSNPHSLELTVSGRSDIHFGLVALDHELSVEPETEPVVLG